MGKFGGMTPFPRRFGGGKPRVQIILESLNADRGTAFDASNSNTTVYVNDMAIARAISAAWGTNQRLANMWLPTRMSTDVLERWETIFNLHPAPTDSEDTRRGRVENLLARFGQGAIHSRLQAELSEALGSAFVAVEYISYANAVITVPDGTYPWGSVAAGAPWSSTTAHILVRMQKPSGWTEKQFYDAAGQVPLILDPIMPVWTIADWYRPGPVSVSVSGGPSAGGIYLDDDHNLDNEVFDV